MDTEDVSSFERFQLDFDSTLWEMAARRGLVGGDEERPCDSVYSRIVQELLGISQCLPHPEEFSEEGLHFRFLGYLDMCQSPMVGRLPVDLLMQATYLAKYRYLDDEAAEAA